MRVPCRCWDEVEARSCFPKLQPEEDILWWLHVTSAPSFATSGGGMPTQYDIIRCAKQVSLTSLCPNPTRMRQVASTAHPGGHPIRSHRNLAHRRPVHSGRYLERAVHAPGAGVARFICVRGRA